VRFPFLLDSLRHNDSRQSPLVVRVKEEDDHDMLDATPTPPATAARLTPLRPSQDTTGVSLPSLLVPPSKKRRVTVSGGPHALGLNTDVRAPSLDPSSTTPISPAVMGFTIGRDDPTAIEQVRSMLTVKQRQKALIEQRRGSVAGAVIVNPSNSLSNEQRRGSVAGILTVPPSGDSPRPPDIRLSSANPSNSAEDRPSPKPAASVRVRRSPNLSAIASTSRRVVNSPSTSSQSGSGHPTSPKTMTVSSQPMPVTTNKHLPPPPISFARRRAGQFGPGKNKPADIVISPRETQSPDQFAPSIQSAPPVPHAQSIGRFPMTIPRLPSAMGDSQKIQRVTSGKVPPTPTRLTMQRGSSTAGGGITGRSPPASVPISSTLVPPTPTSLHRPGYVGEKPAFLAPFEMFYDSLNDSKQLKSWLSEQLQKSNALIQSLQHQQDNIDDIVERAIEKKMGKMRDEITGLHQKVEELEGALRLARADELGRRSSVDVFGVGKGRGKYLARNGLIPAPEPPVTYTFPPVEPPKSDEFLRRLSSPGWGHETDREGRLSERPPPHSASSIRHEHLRPQPMDSSQTRSQPRSGFAPLDPAVKHTLMPLNSRSSLPPRPPQAERSASHHHRSTSDLNGVGKPPDDGPSATGGSSRRDVIMSPPQDIRRAPADTG
jgi:hypothetical protein